MPGLVPGIHVFGLCRKKTWMAGINPAMTEKSCSDHPYPYADRTDRDSDVVATRRIDGRDGKDSRLSIGGDHVRDRRDGRASHLHRTAWAPLPAAAAAVGVGRRRRRIVRLSRALLSGAALRAARGGRTFELPVAALDRSVLILPARRAAGRSSGHRRAGGTYRHRIAARR